MRLHARLARLTPVLALLALMTPAHALDVSGASTIQPIMAKLQVEAERAIGEPLVLRGGGSGAGIKDTLAGKSGIGMVSRALKDDEKARLKAATIGFDALAIIVNRDNPISALSKAQVVDLYTGKADNWQAVGGTDLAVVRITKEVGRSTLELFEGYSGLSSPARSGSEGKPLISKDSHTIGANIEALTLVGGMRGAIGYVSLGTAQAMVAAGMPVKVLSLDGVTPSAQSIVQRSYPIVRELNLVYSEETEPVMSLIGLVLGGGGQEVVKSFGFLPVGAQ